MDGLRRDGPREAAILAEVARLAGARLAPPQRVRETVSAEIGRAAPRAAPRVEDVAETGRAAPSAVSGAPPALRELRRVLRSRRALRQAIILHEIIGPPKALRKPEGG